MWQGKLISALTDDELRDAIRSCGDMDGFRIDKLENARKRHKPLFQKHPPVENETFIQLTTELNNECKSRKLGNI